MIAEPDVIVIGSGFGGSVVASTLVDAGARVALFERGPFRDAAGSARPLLRRVTAPWLPRRGLSLDAAGVFDVHLDRAMTVVSSSGVGGGSHVYFAMNERPRCADFWNGHADEITAETMEPHYRWMLERIGARPSGGPGSLQERLSADATLGIDAAVSQPALGIRDGGRITLDTLLVAPAMARGLAVFASHECLAIARDGTGYRVSSFDHRHRRYRHVTAPRVVVAGGTLNTLRLLFDSRALGGLDGMPALGHGFGGNADVVGLWHAGARGDELGACAPRLARFAVRGDSAATRLDAAAVSGFDEWLVVVGMGCDRADGVVHAGARGLRVRYDARSDRAMGAIHDAFATLGRRSRRRVYATRSLPATVHPIGGARLGRDPETSVVDARGAVHGHRDLFVADAAALPGPPGAPPSMTIAAWARHIAGGIAAHG